MAILFKIEYYFALKVQLKNDSVTNENKKIKLK